MTDVEQRVFLITGATGAIGEAIARQIAATVDNKVVIVGRDPSRTRQAAEEISYASRNENIAYEIADLARQSEIKDLVSRWNGPLHVLVNNAAATPRRRTETAEGLEMQFATNIMGYFWMTTEFTPILTVSAPARIVNVASYWAGDLDLHDLQFQRRSYRNGVAYRQSKQANRMLTSAFARRLAEKGISVNACHPGDVNSKLSNDLGFGGHESPDQGARTPVWLATSEIGQRETGKYFEDLQVVPDRFTRDDKAVEALFTACLRYCN